MPNKNRIYIYIVCLFALLYPACKSLPNRFASDNGKISINRETKTLLKTVGSVNINEADLINAIERLGKTGSGEDVKERLISLNADKRKTVRIASLDALHNLFARERFFLSLKNIYDSNYKKRARAFRYFMYIDERIYEKRKIEKLLIYGLNDKSWLVRVQSLFVLNYKKAYRAVPAITNLLINEPDKGISKTDILDVLINIGNPAIPSIFEKISDPAFSDVSSALIRTLFKIGGFISEDTLPVLAKMDKKLRVHILENIRKHIRKNGSADFLVSGNHNINYYLNEILKKEKDPEAAVAVIRIIINIGDDDPFLNDILATMLDILNDKREDEFVQSYASTMLSMLNPELSAPFLVKFLEGASIEGKRNIIRVFAKIKLPGFIQPLKRLLKNKELEDEVYTVLVNIHDPSTVPFFVGMLKENNMSKVNYAVKGLRAIGYIAAPEVAKLLTDDKVHVRLNAIHILNSIATVNEEPFLMKALNDELPAIRKMAALTLGRLGTEDAIPELIKAMMAESSSLQVNQAAKAIELMGEKAVSSLLKLMKSEGHREKVYAAWVLAKIGSREALNPIKKLAREISDSNVYVLIKSKDPASYALVQGDALAESLRIIEKNGK